MFSVKHTLKDVAYMEALLKIKIKIVTNIKQKMAIMS